MTEQFAGRTAIITGGNRGIGLGIAQHLVDEGARVVITGRSRDAIDTAVNELGGADKALGVAGSADDETHQGDTVQQVVDAFGSVALLVNNVGIKPPFARFMGQELDVAEGEYTMSGGR